MSRLFLGYAGPERAVPCVCGGFVVADPTLEGSVTFSVQTHQRTERHILWRERFEEGGVFIVARVVETPDGTFLEPVERVQYEAQQSRADTSADGQATNPA